MPAAQKSWFRVSIALIFLFILPALACGTTSTATPTPTKEVKTTPYTETKEGEVNLKDVPVRAGPGTKFEQLGTVAKGVKLTMTGVSSDNNWYRIKTPVNINDKGKEVWISVLYVNLVEPTMPAMPPQP